MFTGGCGFYVGGCELLHPLCGFYFGGSVCAIGGSLSSDPPLCSDFDCSCFLLPESKETMSIAKLNPPPAPSPRHSLSDPELASRIPSRLPISRLPISRAFQRLHTPQTPVNSLLSTFRSGPTRKICSSDVSSAQNDVRASALRAFLVCTHLHVNPGRTSLSALTYM